MENSHSPETGGLTSIAEHTRKIVGSIPTPQRMSSGITSPTARGSQSGETLPDGSSAGKSGAALIPTDPGRWERAQLATLNLPEATKRSMTNSLLSAIVHMPQARWDRDGQMMLPKPRFQMKVGVMDQNEIRRNQDAVLAGFTVARQSDVVPIVAALKARTRGRNEGDSEARFGAQVLVNDLCGYPPDVVKGACEAWIDTPDGKWFPTWAELKDLCEERMQGRRALQRGLAWLLDQTR